MPGVSAAGGIDFGQDDGEAAAEIGLPGQNIVQSIEVITVPILPEHGAAQDGEQLTALTAGGEVERHLRVQGVEQTETAGVDIPPCRFKIARVPRVGDSVSGTAGVLEQQVQLTVRVAAEGARHIAHIRIVHADEEIVIIVILRSYAARGLALAADAVLGELAPGGRIDGVAELFAARRGGGDIELRREPRAGAHIAQHEFCHRAAADIAVAYK